MLPKRLHLPLPHGAHDHQPSPEADQISSHFAFQHTRTQTQTTQSEGNHKCRPTRSLWSAAPPANRALGAGEAKATRDGLHTSSPPGCGFLANKERNDGREEKTAGADHRERSPDEQSLIPSQCASETGVWMLVYVRSAAGDDTGVKTLLLLLLRNGAGLAS